MIPRPRPASNLRDLPPPSGRLRAGRPYRGNPGRVSLVDDTLQAFTPPTAGELDARLIATAEATHLAVDTATRERLRNRKRQRGTSSGVTNGSPEHHATLTHQPRRPSPRTRPTELTETEGILTIRERLVYGHDYEIIVTSYGPVAACVVDRNVPHQEVARLHFNVFVAMTS